MKKQIKIYAIIFLSVGMVTLLSECASKQKKEAAQGNVVNDLKAYQHPDSLKKYAVGSEFNPVKK